MKLSDQVCSLEIAKRLKELGVKQESLFYHTTDLEKIIVDADIYRACPDEVFYSAYTVAELGEILRRFRKPDIWVEPGGNTSDGKWIFYSGTPIESDTEADARGKMLIHLLEQGLIKASDL